MVSLGPDFSMSLGGARFTSEEDDRTPVLAADNENNFKPLKTIPAFSIHLLISTIISLSGIILAVTWPDSKKCEAYFIMLYLRGIFWIITFLINHRVKSHHEKLRLNGYHEFYKITSVHRKVPLFVVSLWNNYILFVQTLLQHIYGSNFGEHCIQGIFSPIVYITSFSIIETLILSAVIGWYIARVYKFNQAAPPPDALRGSLGGAGSVGLVQPGASTAELLEKQADLISYLREHNMKLNQKLMQLNAQVQTIRIINED